MYVRQPTTGARESQRSLREGQRTDEPEKSHRYRREPQIRHQKSEVKFVPSPRACYALQTLNSRITSCDEFEPKNKDLRRATRNAYQSPVSSSDRICGSLRYLWLFCPLPFVLYDPMRAVRRLPLGGSAGGGQYVATASSSCVVVKGLGRNRSAPAASA